MTSPLCKQLPTTVWASKFLSRYYVIIFSGVGKCNFDKLAARISSVALNPVKNRVCMYACRYACMYVHDSLNFGFYSMLFILPMLDFKVWGLGGTR